MKAFFNTIHYFLVAGVIAIGLLLLGTLMPIPGNFKVKIVKSGSMEPYIKTGGIVIIRPEADYGTGDVITFGADTKTQIPTTHRIVDVSGTGASRVFTTKGDANDAPDPTQTRLSDVKGKVLFTVPYAGFILDFARKPIGFGLLVGVPAFAIILDEIGKIIREVRRFRRKKNQNQDGDEGGDRNLSGGSVGREQGAVPTRDYVRRQMFVDGIIRPQAFAQNTFPHTQVVRGKSNPGKMFIALFLVLGAFTGLSSLGSTSSYFADGEISVGNLLKAGAVFLTLSATEDSQARVASFSRASLLPQNEDEEYAEGSESFRLTVGQGEGSLPLYYSAWGEFEADQPEGCKALTLSVESGSYSWSGAFTKFVLPATTTDETLDFVLTLPKENTIPKGGMCSGNIVFRAHPQGISTLISNIFTDEKKYSFTIHNYGDTVETPVVLGDATTTPDVDTTTSPVENSGDASSTPTTTPEVVGGGGGSTEVPAPVEPEAPTIEPVVEEATSTPEVIPPSDSSSAPVVETPADPAPTDVVVPSADTPSLPADTSSTP